MSICVGKLNNASGSFRANRICDDDYWVCTVSNQSWVCLLRRFAVETWIRFELSHPRVGERCAGNDASGDGCPSRQIRKPISVFDSTIEPSWKVTIRMHKDAMSLHCFACVGLNVRCLVSTMREYCSLVLCDSQRLSVSLRMFVLTHWAIRMGAHKAVWIRTNREKLLWLLLFSNCPWDNNRQWDKIIHPDTIEPQPEDRSRKKKEPNN